MLITLETFWRMSPWSVFLFLTSFYVLTLLRRVCKERMKKIKPQLFVFRLRGGGISHSGSGCFSKFCLVQRIRYCMQGPFWHDYILGVDSRQQLCCRNFESFGFVRHKQFALLAVLIMSGTLSFAQYESLDSFFSFMNQSRKS